MPDCNLSHCLSAARSHRVILAVKHLLDHHWHRLHANLAQSLHRSATIHRILFTEGAHQLWNRILIASFHNLSHGAIAHMRIRMLQLVKKRICGHRSRIVQTLFKSCSSVVQKAVSENYFKKLFQKFFPENYSRKLFTRAISKSCSKKSSRQSPNNRVSARSLLSVYELNLHGLPSQTAITD